MAESIRCAIYTRKSADIVAEQEVNSLHAQREVCSAYIKCNAHLGWEEIDKGYDDGGRSGANLDRPALHELILDVERGLVDVIVFYKIDRLTRSLSDFVRLMDSLARHNVAFVSVTQSFDTSTSMGRMILNVLLTFAQFEREMLADRIRDKLTSLRQRGLHVQGRVPLGYDKVAGRLIVNSEEAAIVRSIFERFERFPTIFALMRQLQGEGVTIKKVVTRAGRITGGVPMHRGALYALIKNPIYIGYISCKGTWYEGVHEPIIDRSLWDRVQEVQLARSRPKPPRDPGRNLLSGLIYDGYDRKLFVQDGGSLKDRYRFYQTAPKCRVRKHYLDLIRVRADHVEDLTYQAIATLLADPDRVRRMLLSTGTIDIDMNQLGQRCSAAAAAFMHMDRLELREFYQACLIRIEVAKSELRLLLSIRNLIRFASGEPVPALEPIAGNSHTGRAYLLTINAHVVSAHRDFCLPIQTADPSREHRINRKLVNLLRRASEAQEAVLSRRGETIRDISADFKLGPSKFSRLLRLNYLAPDIKTAICDGAQPQSLSPHDLIYSALPLDWDQQRRLLGFIEPSSHTGEHDIVADLSTTLG
ncbi:recombinase family protein [Sphingomonas sp. BN140010]|uniref:Recombinase family protein n=1 Tax=Sphingomonas arvum TaxID=2992113 RepID=A0ABT3JBR3_9SPHN|nr:recombinase family protein [Sphingomonas sp. BN140010]MCW3796505.1 recombinase family protein [Sphingomonas sp. BN140010]